MGPDEIRIFISSPGDVAEERVVAHKLVRRLADEYADRASIKPVFWEHEPLVATGDFQSQLSPPSECKIVICILWSRLGMRLPAGIKRPNSDRDYYDSGTEYEFENAVEGWKKNRYPDLLVYRKTAESVVSLNDTEALLERVKQKKSLDAFIKNWFFDATDGTLKAASHEFETSAGFELVLEEHLRKLIQKWLPMAAPVSETAKISWSAGSPFRGLQAFEFEHAAVFFGRTRAVGDVLNALRKNAGEGKAFVLVTGISGGGKSSLVRAGVLPLLVQPGVVEGVGLWRRAIMRPSDAGNDLFLSLARALLEPAALPELARDRRTAEELAPWLRDRHVASEVVRGGLSQAASDAARARNLPDQPETKLLLVVDQMEEIFTAAGVTAADRAAFVGVMGSLAANGRCFVLATLRGDFYHRCQELPELVALKAGAGTYDLVAPTGVEIGQMVSQPARAAGLRFEHDPTRNATLDADLLDAAAASPDCLPLLEFTLEELYKKRTPEGLLTYEAYRHLGGVDGALANKAEEVYQNLPEVVQGVLPKVFRHLVSIGEGETPLRRQAYLESAASTPEAGQMIEAFVQARLLTNDHDADDRAVLRVTHEALLRRWPRLVRWLENDRKLLRIRARVSSAVTRWESAARRHDLLLPQGEPLEEAVRLATAFDKDLSDLERQFIDASVARDRARRRVKSVALGALVTFAVVAITAAIFANRQRGLARQSAARTSAALQNEQLARKSAEVERQNAEEARKNAEDVRGDNVVLFGDALKLAGRTADARLRYHEGYDFCRQFGRPTLPADVGLSLLLDESIELAACPVDSGTLCVALTGDGRTALSGGPNGTIKIRDLATAREVKSIAAHIGAVTCITVTPDGRYALSGGDDMALRLWDLTGKSAPRTFAGHTGAITNVALTPDGHFALSGGDDKKLLFWNLAAGHDPRALPGTVGASRSVALTPNGRFALAAGDDNTLKVWDVMQGGEPKTLIGHVARVSGVAITPDGHYALSGSDDKTVRFWDITITRELKVLFGHDGPVRSVAMTDDGRFAFSGSDDNTVKVWDLNSGALVRTLSGHERGVSTVAVTPDARFALSFGDENVLKLWQLSSGRQPMILAGHVGEVSSVVMSPTGRFGLSGSSDKTAKLWDLATGRELKTLRGHKGGVSSVAITADGRFALSGSDDKTAKLWDLAGSAEPRTLTGHTRAVSSVALTPNGHHALTGSDDKKLRLWDLTTRLQPTIMDGKSGAVRSVALTPDGQSALSAIGDGLLKVWDLPAGQELKSIKDTDRVSSVAITPDAKFALSGGDDHNVKLWDLSAGKQLKSLKGHDGPVYCVAMTADGRFGVSSGATTLKLWDLTVARELANLTVEKGQIFSAAITGDGRFVLCGGMDKVLKLWDLQRGMELERRLQPVRAILAKGSDDAASLLVLGQWYAYRGVDDWAADLLEQARTGGADVSPLMLGRCYWRINRIEDARREFKKAFADAADPQEKAYLNMCIQALRRAGE